MIITLTFKTPDVLDQAIEQLKPHSMDEDDGCGVPYQTQLALELISKYVDYGEYLKVEFNTKTKSVTVVKCK